MQTKQRLALVLCAIEGFYSHQAAEDHVCFAQRQRRILAIEGIIDNTTFCGKSMLHEHGLNRREESGKTARMDLQRSGEACQGGR